MLLLLFSELREKLAQLEERILLCHQHLDTQHEQQQQQQQQLAQEQHQQQQQRVDSQIQVLKFESVSII